MAIPRSVTRLVWSLASIGVTDLDDDANRAQKAALTLAASLVTVLAVIWVGTYWALGLPVAAAIPLTYQLASVASMAVFARSKSYHGFRFSQAAMMTVLPFLLQWTLGGFVASSAVSLWALVAAIGTLFFFTARESIPWFVVFVGLTVVSGVLEPIVSTRPAPIPDAVRTVFFVLNVTGVSLTAYVLLQYAVRARDEAFARSENLLLNMLPRPIVQRLKREPGVIADAHLQATVTSICRPLGLDLAIRIGMESGPVIAGVIGRHKFIYDLWGDTVNTASRLESHGLPGRIQVGEATYRHLCDQYTFEDRGEIELKGKGRRHAYLLVGRLTSPGAARRIDGQLDAMPPSSA